MRLMSVPHMNFLVLAFTVCPRRSMGFVPPRPCYSSRRACSTITQLHETTSFSLGQSILNFALETPLWKHVLVPQARSKMVKTAESNGILWLQAYEWIRDEMNDELEKEGPILDMVKLPSYYQKPFHAYAEGNLSWDAAFEQELASCAVGARNVPLEGKNGEHAFRTMFEDALAEAGASVPTNGIIVDLGCGTGRSTRRLGQQWKQAARIIGIDMSPYFVKVGQRLLELQPQSTDEGGPWVSTIHGDDRISFRVGNAQDDTGLSDVDIVQLQFVAHELPPSVAKQVVDEAFRMLKPGGQFWVCEMDFETPGYAAQRANPALFALIRATEPYLDEYADSAADFRQYIAHKFSTTTVVAATGRHFALVAIKGNNGANDGVMNDLRFDADGNYRKEDTHLKVWENKRDNA